MPLLHLWYLSVILQVYLFYAVGNQVLQRLPRRVIICVLTLLGIASLLYNYSAPLAEWLASVGILVADFGAGVSYYRTLPRLREVFAGGLVCILPDFKRTRSFYIAAAAGVVCVLFAVFAPTIPGMDILTARVPYTLLTVLGTVLLLRYTPQCRGVHGILSNKVLLWLGAVSFSLYLVHMPVVVYLRIWTLGQPELWWSLLMLAVSLPLAYLGSLKKG